MNLLLTMLLVHSCNTAHSKYTDALNDVKKIVKKKWKWLENVINSGWNRSSEEKNAWTNVMCCNVLIKMLTSIAIRQKLKIVKLGWGLYPKVLQKPHSSCSDLLLGWVIWKMFLFHKLVHTKLLQTQENQNGGYLGQAPIRPKIKISETKQIIYQ